MNSISAATSLINVCSLLVCLNEPILAVDANNLSGLYLRHSDVRLITQILGPAEVVRSDIEYTVVKIMTPGNSGTGVFVVLPNGKLGLVTSAHVTDNAHREEDLSIVLQNGLVYTVKASIIKKIGSIDAAVIELDVNDVKFKSSIVKPAKIANKSISIGEKVYVAGFPADSEYLVGKTARVSEGEIQTISSLDKAPDGYALGYSSKTYVGMSGGGLFMQNGTLLGIHGRGEAIGSDLNKSGTNYAIPISAIFDLYRKQYMNTEVTKIDPESASISILTENLKQAAAQWRRISESFPDSFIAKYNFICLEKRIGSARSLSILKNELDMSDLTRLGNDPHGIDSERLRKAISADPLGMSKNPASMTILNDPLVLRYLPRDGKEKLAKGWLNPYSFELTETLRVMIELDDNDCETLVLTSPVKPIGLPFDLENRTRNNRQWWPR